MNTPLHPHIFLFMAGYRNLNTFVFCFFLVICWSYLQTEISVILFTGTKLHSRLHPLFLSFLWNHFESAKFIHGTEWKLFLFGIVTWSFNCLLRIIIISYWKLYNCLQKEKTNFNCSVGWGCKIYWLHICREVRPPPPNECPGYDTKQSDGKAPIMLELWGMQSTPSLPLLPGLHWPGMIAPDRALSMGWKKTNCIFMPNWIVWIRIIWLNWIGWNRNVFDK